eukprot:302371_1
MGLSMFIVILNTLVTFLFVVESGSREIYVSKSGTDDSYCGNLTHPCATLWDAQRVLESLGFDSGATDIHIVDGQNETRLIEIIADNPQAYYHPCLLNPMTYSDNKYAITLNIVFNSSTIRDLNDWFPRSICVDPPYASPNEYMFEQQYHLNLYNLIVNDYSTDSLGIALSSDAEFGSLSCHNCTFIDIVSTSSNTSLLSTRSSIHLTNTVFENIDTVYNIISTSHTIHTGGGVGGTSRAITIKNGMFININSDQSIIHIAGISGIAADSYVMVNLTITNTEFSEISTGLYVVHDESVSATIAMSDLFFNMSAGCVFRSAHSVAGAISINNIQLWTNAFNQREDPLFSFASADITSIYNMNVSYIYDVDEWMALCYEVDYLFNLKINGYTSWRDMRCSNPTPLLENDGQLVMRYVDINVDVLNEFRDAWYKYTPDPFYRYQYDADLHGQNAFIQNRNSMEIDHMFVSRTISYTFIYNKQNLVIESSEFNIMDDSFNPNALRSYNIVNHFGNALLSTVNISNSYFTGSTFQIHAEIGTMEISHSMFAHSAHAMQIKDMDAVIVTFCEIANTGQFYGPIFKPGELTTNNNHTQGVLILNTDEVYIMDSLFSSYDPHGLLYLSDSSQISLINNVFIIKDNAIYYRTLNESNLASPQDIGFWSWFSPLTILGSESITIVNNDFTQNAVDALVPWIHFEDDAYVCLAGNTFNNTAFEAQWTSITSCFRPKLLVCAVYVLNDESEECADGLYGHMDRALFNQQNTFIVSDDATSELITAYHSNISLDNVNIISENNEAITVFSTLEESIMFLVDAYMGGIAVTYNENNRYPCMVLYNDHLQSDTEYIARFLMDCNNRSGDTLTHYPMNLVDHLSTTKIEVLPSSAVYYPGDWLQFTYHLTDRRGQTIHNNSLTTTINLFNPDHVLIEPLYVVNGSCETCELGVLITDISMRMVGYDYAMSVEVDNMIILEDQILNISIIGCPIGYSPDPNRFLCELCNTDYYSLSPNNTDNCMPCDPDTNKGVKCSDGAISVSYNNWMGMHQESIMSAECPRNFCCANKTGCRYGDDELNVNKNRLCATNRDDTSTLCGRCAAGYSESLLGTQCVQCDESLYIVPIIYPTLLALLWALGLVILSSDKKKKKRSSEAVGIRAYLSNAHFIMMNKILLTRNIIYYQQALTQILSSNPFMAFFVGLTQIFNLSITRNEADSAFAQCFMDGMTGKGKILMDLFMPSMVLLFIIIAHIASICLEKRMPFLFSQRKHNFPKCYSAAFILMIGNILSVLFRLMHCQSVGPYHVHYYFGNEMCFERTWIICLLALLFIIAVFIGIMVQLKRIGNKARSNRSSTWNIFVDKYKPQCFWWEFVLFIRRICIAMFSVSFDDPDSRVVFCMVILIFYALQWRYEPFIVQSANQMECWLLLGVIMVIMMEAVQDMNYTFKSIIVLLLVLLPFGLMAYYIALFVKHKKRDDFSLSLLKKRLMYLFLCVMMHYAPSKSHDPDGDVEVVYRDEEEEIEESGSLVEVKGKPGKECSKELSGSTSSENEFEDEKSETPDVTITEDNAEALN